MALYRQDVGILESQASKAMTCAQNETRNEAHKYVDDSSDTTLRKLIRTSLRSISNTSHRVWFGATSPHPSPLPRAACLPLPVSVSVSANVSLDGCMFLSMCVVCHCVCICRCVYGCVHAEIQPSSKPHSNHHISGSSAQAQRCMSGGEIMDGSKHS